MGNKFISKEASNFSGRSVSSAGDVDGDGNDDLLIGAYLGTGGGTQSGEVFLITAADLTTADLADGAADGVIDLGNVAAQITSYKFIGEDQGDETGRSVSSAGDVDGDGKDDLLIGAYLGGDRYSGESYLLLASELASADLADGTTDGLIDLSNFHPICASATLIGTAAADTLRGGGCADSLSGAGGNDYLYGNKSNDVLAGGVGKDRLYGGKGNDRLNGNNNNDTLDGGAGKDRLNGGKGNDTLKGGAGRDKLKGNSGNDTLDGGKGLDKLTGGKGSDVFVFTANANRDTVTDFQDGLDSLQIAGHTGGFGALEITSIRTNLEITHDGGVIVLQGMAGSILTDADFDFV